MPGFIKNNKLGEAHYGHKGRPGQRGGSLPSKSIGGYSPETTAILTSKDKRISMEGGTSSIVNPSTAPSIRDGEEKAFIFVPSAKSTIYSLHDKMSHYDITKCLPSGTSETDKDKLLDTTVHGYLTKNGGVTAITFNIHYAGAVSYNRIMGRWVTDEDKALRNIYKALGSVRGIFPSDTRLIVRGMGSPVVSTIDEAYHLKILNSREITIAEAKRVISSKLPNLDADQRKIYDAHAWTPKVDLKRIKDAILKERIRVAEAQITNLLNSVGCAKQIGRLTNTGIYDILASESEKDALSIVNTRNYELVNLILNTGYPTASDIKSWDSKRARWKGQQVGTWTVGSTRHFISEEFFARNSKYLKDTDGTAILVGKNPAAEPICQGWLNRGRVPIKEALQSKWPPHIGCVHVWEFEPKKVIFFKRRGVCPLLWRGE